MERHRRSLAKARRDVQKLLAWCTHGKTRIDPMITRRLTLEQINHGLGLMHEGTSIRAVVVC